MGKFILGVVFTLAVLHPAVTKTVLASIVDTTHNIVTSAVMKNAK